MPLAGWTTEDVCEWISRFDDLRQYEPIFKEHDINGNALLELTIENLRYELAIVSLGHRMRILREIMSLKTSLNPTSPPNSSTPIEGPNSCSFVITHPQHIVLQSSTGELTAITPIQLDEINDNLKKFPPEQVKNISWVVNVLKSFHETLSNVKITETAIKDMLLWLQKCLDIFIVIMPHFCPILVPALRKARSYLQELQKQQNIQCIVKGLRAVLLLTQTAIGNMIKRFEEKPIIVSEFDQVLSTYISKLQEGVTAEIAKAVVAAGGTALTFLAGANVLLPILGFGAQGITAGSFAAGVMGPGVAASSLFAILQSAGVVGFGAAMSGGILLVGAAVGGIGYGTYKVVKHLNANKDSVSINSGTQYQIRN